MIIQAREQVFQWMVLGMMLWIAPAVGDGAAREAERVYEAPEAHQGIAVSETHLFAVDSQRIAQYDRETGERLRTWEATEEIPLIHLNSGVVVGDRLYCAHSNYPALPMVSSIEIWNAESVEHVDSHSFGIGPGSCTWIDWKDESWWVMFVHYEKRGGYPDKGVEWSTLVRYDAQWRELESWVFPEAVVAEFRPYSCSGGAWGAGDILYCTGHDAAKLYRLALPAAGGELKSLGAIDAPIEGQGIALDPLIESRVFGIVRSRQQIIQFSIPSEKE